MTIHIPLQLQQQDFRFCLLEPKSKKPFEKDWQNKGYTFDDPKLLKHIGEGGNYGVIGGYGNLRIIDADDKVFANDIKDIFKTFVVETGSGGKHIYIISDYDTNHVFKNNLGEFRAKNYQVVGANCIHPNGNVYKIVNDVDVFNFSKEELKEKLKPYLRPELNSSESVDVPKIKDESRSGKEFREIIKLIGKGLTKEKVFEEMQVFAKWSSSPQGYKELTYNKALKFVEESNNYDNKKDKIKSFLIEDRQKYESLGCGFHNGVYYFGTRLFRENKGYTAIITSDKKAYVKSESLDEIRNIFCLNYKDDFFDEGLDNCFSREAITKWLYEDTNYITIKKGYDKLIKIFKEYIYFDDERKYSLLACYRIASFFMPVWRARARLFIWAEMGSAKSRLSQILHNTGFNSIALGDWTLAYLQRLIESTRGETHIDDFETLDEDKKNSTTRLVKTGFMRGFKSGKVSEGNKKRPEVYDLFNTTTLNNTEGLDFISTDRCITIRIPKISKKEYDKEPDFSKPIWKELRDELYILGLKDVEDISNAYETITSDKIRGRLFFIIKPELTIAKLISQKVYEDIENFWIEETEQRDYLDYETDWEFLALKQIYKLLSTQSTNSTLSTFSTLSTTNYFTLLDDVVKPIGLDLYDEREFKEKKRSMSIIIGNSLKRNPIFKKRQVKGKTQYKVNFDDLKALLESKRFLKPILDILGILDVENVDRVESVGKEMCREPEKTTQKHIFTKLEKGSGGVCFNCKDINVLYWEDQNKNKYCPNCHKKLEVSENVL